MRSTLKRFSSMMALGFVALLSSCSPDESGTNGLEAGQLDASFTITPIDGSANRFRLTTNNNEGAIKHIWNTGGVDMVGGDYIDVFLPDIDTYTIRHTVTGIGGTSVSAEQPLNVTTADPIAGNLIRGGKFKTLEDYNQFQILTISAGGTAWSYDATNQWATIQGGGWNQQGIFQAVQVEGGKTYAVNMRVKGSGSINTWFELYVSQTAPTQGSDYSADGKRMQINTWAGCGGSPYDGLFSSVQCAANETSGRFITFANSGTAYLVVKCGGENIGSVSIDDVEMRRTN